MAKPLHREPYKGQDRRHPVIPATAQGLSDSAMAALSEVIMADIHLADTVIAWHRGRATREEWLAARDAHVAALKAYVQLRLAEEGYTKVVWQD